MGPTRAAHGFTSQPIVEDQLSATELGQQTVLNLLATSIVAAQPAGRPAHAGNMSRRRNQRETLYANACSLCDKDGLKFITLSTSCPSTRADQRN